MHGETERCKVRWRGASPHLINKPGQKHLNISVAQREERWEQGAESRDGSREERWEQRWEQGEEVGAPSPSVGMHCFIRALSAGFAANGTNFESLDRRGSTCATDNIQEVRRQR